MKKSKRTWFVRHAVLMRTLCLSLLLTSIPPLLLSFGLVYSAERNFNSMACEHSLSVAQSCANQFGKMVNQMVDVSYRVQNSHLMQWYEISKDVPAEISAIRTLRDLMNALPFAEDLALYIKNAPDAIYASDGKYDLSIYEDTVLHLQDGVLSNALANMNSQIVYLPFQAKSGDARLLVFIPLNIGTTDNSRVCIFSLSGASINSHLGSILNDGEYSIAAFFAPSGEALYFNAQNDAELGMLCALSAAESASAQNDFFSGEYSGYRAVIYARNAAYLRTLEAYSRSMRIFTGACILVFSALALTLAWLNYQPMARLLRRLGVSEDATDTNEYEQILDTYQTQQSEVSEWMQNYRDSNSELRRRLLLLLLNGDALSDRERDILALNEDQSFVCVANITPNLAQIASPMPGVEALAQENEGYCVFVCSGFSAEKWADAARALLSATGCRALGVGTACGSLHQSYLEAILALETSEDTALCLYDPRASVQDSEMSMDFTFPLMQLARLLKGGDDGAIALAHSLFDGIRHETSQFCYQSYACFQLISSFQRIMEKMELPFSAKRAAQVLNHTSVSAIRDDFDVVLQEALAQVRIFSAESRNTLASNLQQAADEQFTNIDFTLSTLAEQFGLTEYAAGRTFKEATGVSLKKYVTAKRMMYAQALLHDTSLSVADIAAKTGFSSPSYFARAFKMETGVTPNIWRSEHKDPSDDA